VRRRATLVATVLDTITRLTDDTVALFDRAVGRMFRRDGGDPGPFVLIPFKSTSPRSDSWHRIGRNFACAYIVDCRGERMAAWVHHRLQRTLRP
jgi:hypothetical protein